MSQAEIKQVQEQEALEEAVAEELEDDEESEDDEEDDHTKSLRNDMETFREVRWCWLHSCWMVVGTLWRHLSIAGI